MSYTTSISEEIMVDIIQRFRVMGIGQVENLFLRHYHKRKPAIRAMQNLGCNGILFRNMEEGTLKLDRKDVTDVKMLAMIWCMMEVTEDAENELEIYQNAIVDIGKREICFFKDGCVYYMRYVTNMASFEESRQWIHGLEAKGDKNSEQYTRILFIGESREILEKIRCPFPHAVLFADKSGIDVTCRIGDMRPEFVQVD